jgi:PTH1 family peptidyl-tRNA hydrolase
VKLIVGLGNPGPRYRGTRHNVGFQVVDCLASRLGIPLEQSRFDGRFGRGRVQGIEVGLLEPQTFMNNSGRAVAAALAGLALQEASTDLLIVYDDADLPLGRLRLRARGGDGGHLGLRDVIASIGTQQLPRLRFGIGRPPGLGDTVAHVLEEFSSSESDALAQALGRASAAVEVFVAEGIVPAMDRFNAPPPAEDAAEEEGGGP